MFKNIHIRKTIKLLVCNGLLLKNLYSYKYNIKYNFLLKYLNMGKQVIPTNNNLILIVQHDTS